MEKQANHELLAASLIWPWPIGATCIFTAASPNSFKNRRGRTGHAEKILKHLADRDVVPDIGAVPRQVGNFRTSIEVAQAAYDFERANTAGIHAAYEAALAEKDYPAQVLLHWFISEQVEEEAWSDKLLVKTREATCAGAMLNLDRHLAKILNGDSAES